MLLDILKKGVTDRSVVLRIIDSTDGTPETGVVYNTSGIDLWYRREGAAKTSITEATLAALTTAHADGGFLHVGDGYYRFDIPDAAFATAANYVDFGGAVTGMVVIGGRVRLVDIDFEDTVRGGMTALPNVAAEAAGGLYTRGTGAGQINQPANGVIDSNTKTWNALTTVALPLIPTTAGRTLDVSATGEAGLDWANVGAPTTTVALTNTTVAVTQKVDVETIKTQAVTAAAGVTFPTSVASPTNITAGTITTVTNLTNAATAGDLTSTMKASVNAEALDVLVTDTHAELASVPAATSSLKDKINWLFLLARNAITQTATTQLVKADNGSTTVGTSTVSDDATTFIRGEFS